MNAQAIPDSVPPDVPVRRRFGLRSAVCAAAAAMLLGAVPAQAQGTPADSEVRQARTGAPRQRARPPRDTAPVWAGFSADFGVYRPIVSHITISDGGTNNYGQFNMNGIHLGTTLAYLFQDGRMVIGPRFKVTGGVVESMPLGYTIRTNAIITVGGELGFAAGKFYGYGFGGGGGAWVSAELHGAQRRDNTVSAFEVGVGFRYALPQNWYAKTEIAFVTIGDQRLGTDYIEHKSHLMWGGGFGYRFATR